MSGCPLDQAFGNIEDIKVKKSKKDKKNKQKKNEDVIYPTEVKRESRDTTFFNDISGYDEKEKYDRAYISPHNDNYIPHDIEEHILYNQYRDFNPMPELQQRRVKRQNEINERRGISDEEYKEFKMFQKMKHMFGSKMKTNQIEGFANVNDEFNDVLLFGLTGIFFLILIDYIYKLGKNSY